MGCNCGKKRQAQQQAQQSSSAPQSSGQPTTTQSFRLDLEGGRTLMFGSRLEAEAAKVRLGRRGTVSPT